MSESLIYASDKTGFPPGSLVHVGDVLESVTRMSVIDYSKEVLEERQIQSLDEILKYRERDSVTWVIIEGLANVGIVKRLENCSGYIRWCWKIF
jgi:magnesium transporter